MDDVIASRVVGGGACDDERMVQCRDALPGHVLAQAGQRRAGEGLEHGCVDVQHARGGHPLVRGVDERVHGGGHMTPIQQRADCGAEVVVVGISQDEVCILDEERLHGWPRARDISVT